MRGKGGGGSTDSAAAAAAAAKAAGGGGGTGTANGRKRDKLESLLRRARSDRPEPLSERSLPTDMASSFADQPWATVGLLADDPDVAATSDFGMTVEQLSSILENRLADVILQRKREKESQVKAARRAMWHSTSQIGSWSPSSPSSRRGGGGGGGVGGAAAGAAGGRGGRLNHPRSGAAASGDGNLPRRRRRRKKLNPPSPFDGLPQDDSVASPWSTAALDVVLSPACRSEVREYVRTIGAMYRQCHYHRFEHAAHVTASANKLIDMMEECEDDAEERRENAENGVVVDADAEDGLGAGAGDEDARRASRSERYRRQQSLGSCYGDGTDLHLEEPACSYATGDPTVPTVHIDHPKLGEFVRRMSDLHARRRFSADSNQDSGSGGNNARRRDSTASTGTSETDPQQQQQQGGGAAAETPSPQTFSPQQCSGGGSCGPNESQFYFDVGQHCRRHHLSPTFDIASDPLTKFAVVYAALVHDVDHQGVPNRQLVAEGDDLALLYNDKSVAEQHSLKVAFQTLMQPRFATLRHELIPTSSDQFTFRRLVIELVLCTDIASPERMQLAKSKWVEAFGELPRDDAGDGVATVTASRPTLVTPGAGGRGRRGCAPRRASIGVPGYAPSFYPSDDPHSGGRGGQHGGQSPRGAGINAHHTSQGRMCHGHPSSAVGHGGECLGIRRALHLNGSTIEFYAAPGDVTGSNGDQASGGGPVSASPWAASLLAEKRLRASVVLETLMNAADVAHTLQGWDNFLKWNKKLYEELFHAYHVSGRVQRGEADPAVDWYRNQLCFYDIYILPLARKLRRCGAFGRMRGREIVRNAKAVRRRWEAEGVGETERMIREVRERWEEERGEEEERRKKKGQEKGDDEAPLSNEEEGQRVPDKDVAEEGMAKAKADTSGSKVKN